MDTGLSDQKLGELLRLIEGADSVELRERRSSSSPTG